MVCATSKGSDPACAYAQSDLSLCKSFEYSMRVKLLTEHHLEFLSLKGGCTGLCESTLVKNATLLEIPCRGSIISSYTILFHLLCITTRSQTVE